MAYAKSYTAYDREYAKHDNARQRARMKARYWAIKRYGKQALEGKDLDHVVPLAAGGSNDPSNWRIRDVHSNRGDKSVFHRKGFQTLMRRRSKGQ